MDEKLSSRINESLEKAVREAVSTVDKDRAAWLAGYFQGLRDAYGHLAEAFKSNGNGHADGHSVITTLAVPTALAASVGEVTVFYASQSGNGKGFSKRVLTVLESRGQKVKLVDLATYKPRDIKNEKTALFIMSTHGEGEPPPSAVEFFEFLKSSRAPKLDGLCFSVLALGDKSYVQFCQAGRELDERLEALGAKRIQSRVDCDADFESAANSWLESVLPVISSSGDSSGVRVVAGAHALPSSPAKTWSAQNPFQARVLSKINLNGRGSIKETYHIEVSLEGAGVTYQAGDACGLIAQNSPRLVGELLMATGLSGSTSQNGRALEEILRTYEISVLTPDVIRKHNEFAKSEKLTGILGNVSSLKEFVYGRDFVDLVREFPVTFSAADLLSVLRPIPPRLYSIASSPSTYQEEAHLLVGAVRYNTYGRDKEGVASTFWADRIEEGGQVPIYFKSNEGFRLPADGKAPIIMVGPGTGVAPFRAFVEERAALGAEGKSWLFFGNPNFTTDFLYQLEWQSHIKDGRLTRMDVAFSRDQENKHYVQHRIVENSRDVYAWLQEGAYIYVCGDMKRMAADVYRAFAQVFQKEGNLSSEAAIDELKNLRKAGRYLEDVY